MTTTYATTQALKNKLNDGGKILTLSGQSVDNGLPAAPYMSMVFAALHNLTKSHNSKSTKNIHMCDVQLGPIDTRMLRRLPKQTEQE
ncbi:MAG: SDR family oxidoreductase [Candidatus Woesearchaeota archaeon]